MNAEESIDLAGQQLDAADKWILSRLNDTVTQMTAHLNDGDFGLAAQKIYDFSWSEFCDWYIELSKSRLFGEDSAGQTAARATLLHVLEGLLKLLHPFMPFVTEAIYGYLPGREGFIMLSDWPVTDDAFDFGDETIRMQGIIEMVTRIRNLRAEMNVAPGKKTRLILIPSDGYDKIIRDSTAFFIRLAWAQDVQILTDRSTVNEKAVSAVCAAGEFFIPLGDLVDFGKEAERLRKEKENILNEINRSSVKLSNSGFLTKADPELINAEREKIASNRQMMESLLRRIAEIEETLK